MEINADTANKAIETMANIAKIGANLTNENKPARKNNDRPKGGDTNNQQHQQTVEVHVGEQKDIPKPVIIKEKPETHIHKHFPDNRALTKDECDLEGARIQMEYEDKKEERAWQRELELLRIRERKEHEEYERKERLRKEAEQKKRRKVRAAVAGTFGCAALGLIAYGIYSDIRDHKDLGNITLRIGNGKSSEDGIVPAEGEVK